MSIGFIGGGRVSRILIGGWVRAKRLPDRVLVHDPCREALDALLTELSSLEVGSLQEAAGTDVVFLALHPPVLLGAASAIRPFLRPDAIVVSLAPKVPLHELADAAGTSRVARMIPNAPSIIGRGYNPIAYGSGLDDRARAGMAGLFAPWGVAPEVAEAHLEAYAILTGMGPTYFWYQWQSLRDLAVEFGLSAAEADRALRFMIEGAMSALLDAELSPAAVMDLVPVKPLSDLEAEVSAAYRSKLAALFARIRPAQSAVA